MRVGLRIALSDHGLVATLGQDSFGRIQDPLGEAKAEWSATSLDLVPFRAAVLAWHPESEYLLASWDDGWPADEPTTLRRYSTEGDVIGDDLPLDKIASHATFAPDGIRMVVGFEDGTARVMGLDGREPVELPADDDGIVQVAFGPGGRRIATASASGTARLWSEDGTLLVTLEGHTAPLTGLAWSGDRRVATSSLDGTARIWSDESELLAIVPSPNGYFTQVGFADGGRTLITGGSDGTVRRWLARSRDLLRESRARAGGPMQLTPTPLPAPASRRGSQR